MKEKVSSALERKGTASSTEIQGSARRQNRRQALGLGGAAAAAAAVAVLGMEGPKKARAASDGPLILGQDNEQDSGDNTRLGGDVGLGGVFEVGNRQFVGSAIAILGRSFAPGSGWGPGAGVVGESGSGIGVFGEVFGGNGTGIGVAGRSNDAGPPGDGEGSGTGVSGKSGTGSGVEGGSNSGTGVWGHSRTGFGVVGVCDEGANYGVVGASALGTGVHGKSETGAGVNGVCRAGPGVIGEAPGNFPGVRAESRSRDEPYALDGGVALEVVGNARFSTCGHFKVPRGDSSAFVPNPAVTDVSHITVTLMGDPGPRQLQWVQRSPGSGFTVYLTAALRRPETPFTYLIVEPGEA